MTTIEHLILIMGGLLLGWWMGRTHSYLSKIVENTRK
jgi:hypothetical protein